MAFRGHLRRGAGVSAESQLQGRSSLSCKSQTGWVALASPGTDSAQAGAPLCSRAVCVVGGLQRLPDLLMSGNEKRRDGS